MVLKKVSHIVTRPGRITGSSDAEIPVAEDLATVPGVPKREKDLSFYSCLLYTSPSPRDS